MANVTGELVYDTNRASSPLASQIDEPGGNHTKKIRTTFPSPLFASAPDITKSLQGPQAKVPPPFLQADGRLNEEYFKVVAAKAGPYIVNKPPTFPEDHAEDRIARCVRTQEIAQEVHGAASLDLQALKAYVEQTEKVKLCLPTIGYFNMPGPPSDSGGSMVCKGGLILTEDRIILFGAKSNKTASASDFITGTTICTYLCCYMPCCVGFCGCVERCRLTSFKFNQLALRENEDFLDSVPLVNAKVSIKNTSMTQLTREYTSGKRPSQACCKPCCDMCGCFGFCSGCYYHGTHSFSYFDEGNSKDLTIDTLTERTVGHDDTAWSLMDEMALASMLTNKKTMGLFENPDSAECRHLLLKKFGKKFTPEQCQKKVQNMRAGVKTKDLCSNKLVMSVNITHWDTASQNIRTTVCVCDPSQVKPEEMMKFLVEASAAKNSMNDSLLKASGTNIALPKSSFLWGGGGASYGKHGGASYGKHVCKMLTCGLF
jgi:hypothetical protein